ncbi:dienelactone hydrolase family protein [Methylobacillus gramineus]|uniref:alpha/beta hydrolase n=1 Tax=Methylobacillus gramineus TaxID=755169 RepID=UPI001D00159D|nr:alpha/beta fold hydrolase [Methylobacillus gramineus]MCB5186342.1 dienelactone hydrolase family protein [Methylobacillus gramineus]
MQLLDFIEISPEDPIQHSVIWLHGLGADGQDFVPVVHELALPNTRFILPHAPVRPVTVNNGYAMPAWYDIYGFDASYQQDAEGIAATQKQIEALIANEVQRGIPCQHIVLAGFSQGGAIALHTALRYPEPLAAVLALSTYLPLSELLGTERSLANQALPIFMAHGTLDNVITLDRYQASAGLLQAQGYTLDLHEYPMPHSVCMEEINDIRNFLQAKLLQQP